MQNAASALTIWSYGLAAFGYTAFVLYLVRLGFAASDAQRSRAMLLAAASSAAWGACWFLVGWTSAFSLIVAGVFIDLLRYGAWFYVLIALIRPEDGAGPVRGLAVTAGLLVAAGVGMHVLRLLGLGGGDMPRFLLFHALGMIIFAIVLLEQLLRNVSADSRWNIKPLLLALGGVFLFDLYLFSDALMFGRLDGDLFGIRGLIHAAVIPLLAVSITRGGSMLSKIRLSQKVIFHSTTLMLVGIYLIFMALVGYYVRFFGGEWGRAMEFAVLFAALMMLAALLLSGSMRARLRVLIGKNFFHYRYDYREEWLRFTRALSAQSSLQAMGEQVIRGLANMVESPAGGLWLRDPAKRRFVQTARWNMPPVSAEEDEASALCGFLVQSGWVVNLQEYRGVSSRYAGLELPQWLSETDNAWLVIPLVAGNDMIGFVILGRARTEIDVDWEVNDLLKTAGRQAASFLAQILVAEELLEARKFDAFNRMSAFVVHDLKNIVTQLSLLVKNAERHGDNPEFQQDMLMTVQNSVERMRQLMLQLREGATPADAQRGVGLEDIVHRIAEARKAQGRQVEVEVIDSVMARGHEERIERVIGHVIQNALDATDPSGRVWVIVDRLGGRARVTVGDTGHGMSEEFIRERLFKPFQTTKQAGMGIGAYESFQYIRGLGGDVQVESEVGAGSTITMLLPLFDATTGSSL